MHMKYMKLYVSSDKVASMRKYMNTLIVMDTHLRKIPVHTPIHKYTRIDINKLLDINILFKYIFS